MHRIPSSWLWVLPALSLACGGRASLEIGESEVANDGGTGGALNDQGTGSSPAVGGSPASGGSPAAGGAPWGGGFGAGGLPAECFYPDLQACDPYECPIFGVTEELTSALEYACEHKSSVPEYSVSAGCGYVNVSWIGDEDDWGTTFYEMEGGRRVGHDDYLRGGCWSAAGMRPDCPEFIEFDPCSGMSLAGYCEMARAGAQSYFDELLVAGTVCEEDSDCSMVSYGNDCGYICPLSVNKSEIGYVGTNFFLYDDAGLCRACDSFPVNGCPEPPFDSVCVDGRCQLAGEYLPAGEFSPLGEN